MIHVRSVNNGVPYAVGTPIGMIAKKTATISFALNSFRIRPWFSEDNDVIDAERYRSARAANTDEATK